MKSNILCGTSFCHPQWMQRFANTKTFIIVYGFLGTTQAMAYIYFVITLTTLERRFKIPSQTTGFILSGNEISQIMLSLILSYIGGQRNRPRWIAWGVLCCALSCFILAAPHFIYGAGDEVLQLTKEYVHKVDISNLNDTLSDLVKSQNRLCLGRISVEECDEVFTVLPLVLIFLSQFVLGIGNTLYYSLGQSYLDDNTKKTNTPLLLGYAMSLRMFGPVVGFVLGYVALKIFVDPSKTPLIDSKDPRWIGAWWLGWIILGIAMLFFAVLIGLFPKELPKTRTQQPPPHMLEAPDSLMNNGKKLDDEEKPLKKGDKSILYGGAVVEQIVAPLEKAKLKDFPVALMRLLKNKLLMCNIASGIFYILGSSGYITFLSKYFEVQFHKNAADATIISGPITLIGMVSGFLLSGIVISKKKPGPKYLLFWNVIVGFMYMVGQVSYMFLTCPDGKMPVVEGRLNLSTTCNLNCNCEGLSYSPVCHEETGNTFFSPCHAGCNKYDRGNKLYSDCNCVDDGTTRLILDFKPQMSLEDVQVVGAGVGNFLYKTESSSTIKSPIATETEKQHFDQQMIVTTPATIPETTKTTSTDGTKVDQTTVSEEVFEDEFYQNEKKLSSSSADIYVESKVSREPEEEAFGDLSLDDDEPESKKSTFVESSIMKIPPRGSVKQEATSKLLESKIETVETALSSVEQETKTISPSAEEVVVQTESDVEQTTFLNEFESEENETEIDTESSSLTTRRNERISEDSDRKKSLYEDYDYSFYDDASFDDSKRRKRSSFNEERSSTWADMTPGACLKGCALGFYAFVIISTVINCFGASGKIGNLLVNYRCVSTQDKSFTQGLILMMISLFALIPGPIMYGHIIDSTCLIWSEKCGKRGNCQLYDQKSFRLYINITALALTSIGVFFDILVWHYGKNLVLYEEEESTKLSPTNTDSDATSKTEKTTLESDNNGFVKT